MENYENNAYFWQKVDTLLLSSNLEITKEKGDVHPRFKNLIYPTRYGHLTDSGSQDGDGVSVYIGSDKQTVTALVVAADILQKTLDVKILLGCTEEETDQILHFLNQTDFQKTVLIRRGDEIPAWGISDN